MTEIEELVERYQAWLRDKTALRKINEWTEITTPYLDRHNDYVQVYAKKRDDDIVMTDDGHTLADLEASGCSLDSPKRRSLLQSTLNGFGVKLENGALVVRSSPEKFPVQKHNLIQAVLSVNDLFYLSSPLTVSLFLEDVTTWLDQLEVRYVPHVRLPGASGFDHLFDFAIPKSKVQPERLVRAISNPSRDKAESFAFAWHDTRAERPENARAIAILNDNDRHVGTAVIDALNAYGIKPVAWKERAKVLEELIA